MYGRSEYFKSLGHFLEVTQGGDVNDHGQTEITLNDISAEEFAPILTYLYSNDAIVSVVHYYTQYLLLHCIVY